MKNLFYTLTLLMALSSCYFLQPSKKDTVKWVSLFNGQDLDDWIIKINKHDLHENYANTFRVENGLMKVSYDGYDAFDAQYGHIFYKKPFSSYYLRVEYRFVGEQAMGGEDWAYRNSGVMFHAQDPSTMLKNQDFPISVEAQILGGNGKDERSTWNVCTPGTHIVVDDKLFTPHCLNSLSETYHGDQWVQADLLVLGDSIVHHIMNGQKMLTYKKPQIGGENVDAYDSTVKQEGKTLTSGFIALQSESHPIEFKEVKLIDLEPYMKDRKKLEEVLEKIEGM